MGEAATGRQEREWRQKQRRVGKEEGKQADSFSVPSRGEGNREPKALDSDCLYVGLGIGTARGCARRPLHTVCNQFFSYSCGNICLRSASIYHGQPLARTYVHAVRSYHALPTGSYRVARLGMYVTV